MKTEVQHPEEQIQLLVKAPHGFKVYVRLFPRRHVAVIDTQKGEGMVSRRWLGAAYAIHTPPGAFSDGINVRFGALGTISGHLAAEGQPQRKPLDPGCRGRAPVSESGHFDGRIEFRGAGGYLRVSVAHASMYRDRSFRLLCRQGGAEHFGNRVDGLFAYIEPGTFTFSSTDGTFLTSRLETRRRVTEFIALHHLRWRASTFRASALEWLPGEIATVRWLEVSRAPVDAFSTSQPALHPARAMVEPPSPFAGAARYERTAHVLRGNLSVSLPGLDVRLAGKRSEAGICVFTRKMLDRVC